MRYKYFLPDGTISDEPLGVGWMLSKHLDDSGMLIGYDGHPVRIPETTQSTPIAPQPVRAFGADG